MSSSMLAIVLSFFFALLVNAELYVVDPRSGSTCTGGQPCTVTWLEDGRTPLLPSIGLVNAGLYTGEHQLIQLLGPVDVSTVRAFTFTPDPAAGPNSGAYYIGFTSANPPLEGSEIYRAYSPWFSLEGMTGSFESPLPSATEPISISIPPSGSASARPTTSLSTITVGTLSSAEPIPTPSASSSSEASSSPSQEASESGSSTSAPAAPSSSALPSSSGFITSRTPAPSSTPRFSSSTSSEEEPSSSETASEDSSACSTPVSNRVAIFVTLMVALAFFVL